MVCNKPWRSVTILWVVPCCSDYDGRLTLGKANQDTLPDIWQSERLADLRRMHLGGHLESIELCSNCEDKEGYPTGWFYPLSRLMKSQSPIGEEWNS